MEGLSISPSGVLFAIARPVRELAAKCCSSCHWSVAVKISYWRPGFIMHQGAGWVMPNLLGIEEKVSKGMGRPTAHIDF
jgi:hypothetical protein